jgi:hypothetical protein
MSAVAVTGTIDSSGAFRAGWWGSALEPAASMTQVSPDWSVAALDADRRVLAVAPAAVRVVPCGGAEVAARLNAVLPLPETAAAVVVRHGDVEVYRREVPPPAGVHLDVGDARPAMLRREPLAVPVRITGPAGPGAHLVALWESPSQPPAPLGLIDLGAGAPPVVTVDLGALPGGDGCRLRVVYSDGVRTTSVVSEPVDVPVRPATPVIETPAADHRMREDGWLSLYGRLEGDGDPNTMEWLLDGAPIGRGPRTGHARPRVGRHQLTLRHGKESVSVPLTVVAAPSPAAPVPWQPPWRIRPLTVYATPSAPPDFGGWPGR